MVDVVEYCDRPMRKKDDGMLNPNNIPWTHHDESDDSDEEDVVPLGEFWHIPEDEWTVVVRPQRKTRGNHGSSRGQTDTPGKIMDRVRLYSDELEEIMDAEAPLNIRSEVPRIPGMLPTVITEKETVTIKVKPIAKQRPEEIGAMMKTEELFSDGRGVGQNQMTKETSVGTLMVIKNDLIVKPVPSPVIVDVLNKTRTNEGTTEVCAFDILCRNETTKREVSTELLDISRQWIPQGFLRLAEEAKFVGVGNILSGMMTEILPEIAEVTGPTSDSISWKIEEDSEESAVSLGEVMHEVTSIRFDVGQLMRWPDGNSDDTLICEFQLESELFSHGPARREAEPVFVAAESEMFTPVFAGGVVTESEPPVVAEAVTSRVSVLPTVGSKFQTGLSAAVGGEDRWCLSSGSVLDQVGHVAGRLDARMVPVEQFLLFSKVHPVMLAWLRPMFALTSQFFSVRHRGRCGGAPFRS